MSETTDFGADPSQPEEEIASIPTLDSRIGKAVFGLSIVLTLLGLYYLVTQPITKARYTNLHLGLALLIFFLVDTYRRGHPDDWSRRDWLSTIGFGTVMAGGLAGVIYVEVLFDVIAFERIGIYTTADLIVGALLMITVIYATKRAYGKLITAVAVLAILFARYGPYLPGMLNHGGLPWHRIISMSSVEMDGVYHLIVQIGATWIFVFIIWAGIVEELGGLETFFDIGFLIGSRFRSGVAQTAVVASMIMGTINGSPMANAVVTGSFTIPLMKEREIDADVAGAIEAVASTGGMILPPIMGSVAFLMANFLGMSYGEIIVIAALPAFLFYISIALSVHLIVLRSDIDVSVEREVDKRKLAKDFFPILASVLVLVYLLIVYGYPPGTAGVYTIATLLGVEFVKRLLFDSNPIDAVTSMVTSTARGFRTGTVRLVPITVVLAAMGIIITSFNITGIGYRLSLSVVEASGGSVFILLGLVMISAIVLGMGMPTVAAYLLTISLIAPAMVEFGFARVTAHFFVFYFAMLATLTPPIALGPAVTSKIAEAPFLDVAKHGMIIGIPLFLLPYIFAFNESLLVFDGFQTIYVFVFALVGLMMLTLGIHGGLAILDGPLGRAKRSGLALGGLAVVFLPTLF